MLCRAAVLAEGYPGGFAALYPELGDLETLGNCRRGYFVAGLGGAQFAIAGAIERLRESDAEGLSDQGRALVIGAADPAQPWGAAVPWPARRNGRGAKRVFGAQVVLLDGEPVLYLERGMRGLLALREPDGDWLRPAAEALAEWVRADRGRRPRIERFDGESVLGSPAEEPLIAAGFASDLRGLVLRH